MKRIREHIVEWGARWVRMDFAALAAGAIVIAVVPGGLVAWLAWRFLRARTAS